jgi:hypothetical protein
MPSRDAVIVLKLEGESMARDVERGGSETSHLLEASLRDCHPEGLHDASNVLRVGQNARSGE